MQHGVSKLHDIEAANKWEKIAQLKQWPITMNIANDKFTKSNENTIHIHLEYECVVDNNGLPWIGCWCVSTRDIATADCKKMYVRREKRQ